MQVMFIDYGNTEYVPFQSLCEMGAREMQEPAMAFEVELSGVKSATYPRYSDEANERFRELTCGVQLVMRVRRREGGREGRRGGRERGRGRDEWWGGRERERDGWEEGEGQGWEGWSWERGGGGEGREWGRAGVGVRGG